MIKSTSKEKSRMWGSRYVRIGEVGALATGHKKHVLFSALAVCVVVGAGLRAMAYPTLTWTGAASDNQWLTPGNWISDSGAPDPKVANNNYRFVDVPDGTTITIGSDLVINDITLTNTTDQVRSLKITSTKNIKNNSSGCFDICPKSVLNFNCTGPNPWVATYNGFILKGGGRLEITAKRESFDGAASVYSSTLYLDAENGMDSGSAMMSLSLYGDSKLEIGRDTYVKNLLNPDGSRPTVLLNGHELVLILDKDLTVGALFSGNSESSVQLNGSNELTLTNSPTMNGTYEIRNSALRLGTTAGPAVTMPSDSRLDMYSHGGLYLNANQQVGALSGSGVTAFVDIPKGASFTVGGTGEASGTSYAGRLQGAGNFIKQGDDYNLTMSGNSSSFAGATTVAAGTLELSRPFNRADDIVGYWPFDEEDYLVDVVAGRTWGEYSGLDLPKKSSSGVYGDAIEFGETESGVRGLISRSGDGNLAWMQSINSTNFTVSVWIRPANRNNSKGYFFNFGGWPEGHTADQLCLLAFYKDGLKERISGYNGNPNVELGKSIVDGEWHHVVYVHEAHHITIWVDGKVGGSYIDDKNLLYIPIASMDLQIGGKDNWGLGYVGGMDELILANGVWDETRILDEYKRIRRVAEPSVLPTPAAKWTFDKDFVDEIGGVELVNGGTTDVKLQASPGAYGKCISLDNAQKYLKIKDGNSYPFPVGRQKFTVSLRVRYYSADEYTHVFNFGDTYTDNRYFASGFIAPSRCNTLDWNTVGQSSASLRSRDQKNNGWQTTALGWDHIVATYDGSEVTMYRDGRSIGSSKSVSLDLAEGPFYLGYYPNQRSGKTSAGAYVDDLRIWTNCCFTADQVATLARTLEKSENDGQLGNSEVTVNARATLRAVGSGNEVKTLGGDGTLEIANDSSLTSGGGTFVGAIKGSGRLTLTGSTDFSLANAAGFSGYVEVKSGVLTLNSTFAKGQVVLDGGTVNGGAAEVVIQEGATIVLDAANPGSVAVSTTGRLVLPMDLTLAPNGETHDDFAVATAGEFVMPLSTDGWTLPEGFRLCMRGDSLWLSRNRGMILIFR